MSLQILSIIQKIGRSEPAGFSTVYQAGWHDAIDEVFKRVAAYMEENKPGPAIVNDPVKQAGQITMTDHDIHQAVAFGDELQRVARMGLGDDQC